MNYEQSNQTSRSKPSPDESGDKLVPESSKRRGSSSRDGIAHMIMGGLAASRITGPERTKDFYFEYYAPMGRGDPLTETIISLTPDPYYISPPHRGGVPDIFGEHTVWHVNQTVKEIIEDLEPGVHKFIPINIKVRGKDNEHSKYYILYINQVIDAVVIEETDFAGGRRGREGYMRNPALSRLAGDIVLNTELIGKAHLWRGGRGKLGGVGDPFQAYHFCSDALKKRIKEQKIEGWRFRPCILRSKDLA